LKSRARHLSGAPQHHVCRTRAAGLVEPSGLPDPASQSVPHRLTGIKRVVVNHRDRGGPPTGVILGEASIPVWRVKPGASGRKAKPVSRLADDRWTVSTAEPAKPTSPAAIA